MIIGMMTSLSQHALAIYNEMEDNIKKVIKEKISGNYRSKTVNNLRLTTPCVSSIMTITIFNPIV